MSQKQNYISYGASVPRPEIHAQVDKWGIHAELISAESSESLRNYLKKNNVRFIDSQRHSLAIYMWDKALIQCTISASENQRLNLTVFQNRKKQFASELKYARADPYFRVYVVRQNGNFGPEN